MLGPVKRLVDRIVWLLIRFLPRNGWGDRAYAWMSFLLTNRRRPGTRRRMNDVIYDIKVGDEILSPELIATTDKEFAKFFAASVVGDAYVVPTIAVLRTEAEIAAFDFPQRCVIKPTHGSGSVIVRTAGEPVNVEMVRSWLNDSYYDETRERQYKFLKAKVMVEDLVFGADQATDYKVHCWNGDPRFIMVHADRYSGHNMRIYDTDWVDQACRWGPTPMSETPHPRPDNLAEMLDVSARLARYFSFVRIDLYSNGTEIKIGEFTHTPGDARFAFDPAEANDRVAALLFGG